TSDMIPAHLTADMRRVAMVKLPLLLIPLLVLMGCGAPQLAQPAAATADVHLVVSVQGLLSVKRAGWSTYAPVRFGTALRHGALLRRDDSAHARVVCANLSIAMVHPGSGGVPCPIAPAVLTYRESLISTTRAPQSGDFPQVVVPAKTQILDPHPTIRWTAV